MLKPYLEAGKITGTQGLRGEIRVDPWCDSAEALCRLKRLYFEEGKQELKVVAARTQKRMAILKLEGVDSIVTRFKTGAMSYGSISQEAHDEALADDG